MGRTLLLVPLAVWFLSELVFALRARARRSDATSGWRGSSLVWAGVA